MKWFVLALSGGRKGKRKRGIVLWHEDPVGLSVIFIILKHVRGLTSKPVSILHVRNVRQKVAGL